MNKTNKSISEIKHREELSVDIPSEMTEAEFDVDDAKMMAALAEQYFSDYELVFYGL